MSNYLSLPSYFGILYLYLYCTIQQLLYSVYRTTHPAINLRTPIDKTQTHPSLNLSLSHHFSHPKSLCQFAKAETKTDPSNQIKQKMTGRREMHRNTSQSVRKTRIAIAIAIGVTLGCVFAIFFPHGLFTSSAPILTRTISKSIAQVPILQPHFFFLLKNVYLYLFSIFNFFY